MYTIDERYARLKSKSKTNSRKYVHKKKKKARAPKPEGLYCHICYKTLLSSQINYRNKRITCDKCTKKMQKRYEEYLNNPNPLNIKTDPPSKLTLDKPKNID